MEKGIIVELPGGVEGFVPNSHLEEIEAGKQRQKKAVNIGDALHVKVIEFDKENKKIVLSYKEYLKDREEQDIREYMDKQQEQTAEEKTKDKKEATAGKKKAKISGDYPDEKTAPAPAEKADFEESEKAPPSGKEDSSGTGEDRTIEDKKAEEKPENNVEKAEKATSGKKRDSGKEQKKQENGE